ncbi:hypothetical protein WDW89_07555 [Deltaproteobacteria bacterium TL4]
MEIIWVEKLGVGEILILLKRLLWSKVEIRYDEHQISTLAHYVLIFLNKHFQLTLFKPANLTLNTKDEQGYAATYYLHENLNQCLNAFCARYIREEPPWFQKMTKSYLAEKLIPSIAFITMVEFERNSLKAEHTLFIARNPINSIFMEFYQKRGFQIQQSLQFFVYLAPLRPFARLLQLVLTQIEGKPIITNINTIKPSVWVEYFHAEATDRRENLWSSAVKAADFDLVYYMDRSDAPVTEQARDTCLRYGFKWVDLLGRKRWVKLPNRQMVLLIRQLFQINTAQPFWFHFYKLQYTILHTVLSALYRHFQVKILIQHQDCSWLQGVQAKAVESAGGMMLGFQWSHYIYDLQTNHLTPQHLFFVWGKMNAYFTQNKGVSSRFFLPSGTIFTEPHKSKEVEAFCQKHDFIISIFDSGACYNIHQSPESLSQFYLAMLDVLNENPTWAGIIKSKDRDIESFSPLLQGSSIISKMLSLVEQGRLLVCSPLTTALTVAAKTHLSVCFSINSAGILAGISGYRAIHWDCSGWLKHPFYRQPQQQIVYTSLKEFKNAILKVAQGDSTIGDLSLWRRELNHFDDLLGSQRIGHFIQWYMKDIAEIGNMEQALAATVKHYREVYHVQLEDMAFEGIELYN